MNIDYPPWTVDGSLPRCDNPPDPVQVVTTMSSTFLSGTRVPGDGVRLLQSSSQQLRAGKGRQSFLRGARDGAIEFESHKQHRLASFPRDGGSEKKVRRDATPGNVTSFQPRTIANSTPLSLHETQPPEVSARTQHSSGGNNHCSSFVQKQTEEGYKLVHVSRPALEQQTEDMMALPPHLRKKATPTGTPDPGTAPASSCLTPSACFADAAAAPATAMDAAAGPAVPVGCAKVQSKANNIRAKLESLGAKVSEPTPGEPSSVAYSDFDEFEGAMPRKQAEKPPPKVPQESEKASAAKPHEDSPQSRHDSKVVQPSPRESTRGRGGRSQQPRRDIKVKQAPANESTRGPGGGRGRGRGGGGSQNRASRWATRAELAPDPNRWEIKWSDESKQSTISGWTSVCADAGGARGKKGKAGADQGYELADFSGGWAPPPLDWDSRPGFRSNQSAALIDQWQEAVPEEVHTPSGHPVLTSSDLHAPSDLAPRSWIPVSFGDESVESFWDNMKNPNNKKPKCCDEGDLVGVEPWWTTYEDATSIILKPCPPPEIKGIDPRESSDERLARENDQGSHTHAENRKRTEIAKKEAKRERAKKKQEKFENLFKASEQHIDMPTGIKTENLYLRGAEEDDIETIMTIYNHYISYSTCTPEVERLPVEEIRRRMQNVRDQKLPYLVACERGAKLKSGRRQRNGDGPVVLPDKVVGFAFAAAYLGPQGTFRTTAKLEVYTDNHHLGKNIAKCLFDKLLGILDPTFVERAGYDIQGDEAEGTRPCKVINNMIISLPYDRPEVLERKKRWITEDLKFGQVGNLEGIGEKLGKR